jgi:hypothetical protein
MKRFLLFRYDNYYPCGGWSDFARSFDSIAEAVEHDNALQESSSSDYGQIVDTQTDKVASSRCRGSWTRLA